MRQLTLVFALLSASQVFGATVTGGSIQVTGLLTSGRFALQGSFFDVNGGFTDGNWMALRACQPCLPGTNVSPFGYQVGEDFLTGTALVNGSTYPYVLWGYALALKGSTIQVDGPPIQIGGAGVYTGTFTFTGQLCGTDGNLLGSDVCVVDLPVLTGSGRVDLRVLDDVAGAVYIDQATYTFTPEPASLVLAVSALTALGLLRSRFAIKRVSKA